MSSFDDFDTSQIRKRVDPFEFLAEERRNLAAELSADTYAEDMENLRNSPLGREISENSITLVADSAWSDEKLKEQAALLRAQQSGEAYEPTKKEGYEDRSTEAKVTAAEATASTAELSSGSEPAEGERLEARKDASAGASAGSTQESKSEPESASKQASSAGDKLTPEARGDTGTADASGKATQPTASQAESFAISQGPASPSNEGHGSSGLVGADSTSAALAQKADAPNSLEFSLASIQLDGSRQQRLVISGDAAIKAAFYELLAQRGQLRYDRGTPVISLSNEKAIKTLQEAAKRVGGLAADVEAVHALSLTAKRGDGGFFGEIRNGLSNMVGRHHEIDVVVVGRRDVVTAKLKEVAEFAEHVSRTGFGSRSDASADAAKGPALVSNESGAHTRLECNAKLLDVLLDAKSKVARYSDERQQAFDEIKRHKEAKDGSSMDRDKEKTAAGKGDSLTPNSYAAKLAAGAEAGFRNASYLRQFTDKGTSGALMLLRSSARLKDPAEKELHSLPTEQRQKFVTQLAALAERVDSREFSKASSKDLDSSDKGAPSIRQQVSSFIAMEVKASADYSDKAGAMLGAMVESKALTAEQAEKIGNAIKAESEKVHAQPTRVESAESTTISHSPSASTTSSSTAEAKTPESISSSGAAEVSPAIAAAQPADTRASGEALSAKTDSPSSSSAATQASNAAGVTEAAAPSASAAVQSATSTTVVAKAEAVAGSNAITSTGPATAPSAQLAEAAKSSQDGGATSEASTGSTRSGLGARLEDLAKAGPGALTESKANNLVAEMDALRTRPLSALDAGYGKQPTETLVRIESVLKELESGKLGSELKAQARDLAEPLQRWVQQDEQRLAGSTEGIKGNREAVVAAVKAGDSAWHLQASVAAAGQPSKSGAQPVASSATDQSSEQALRWQTASAGEKLAGMMANPPGTFLTNNKTWSEGAIKQAAATVLKIDPESMKHLMPQQQAKLTVYATWLADNANAGKLPGFNSPEGKAEAEQLTHKAIAMIERLDSKASISKDVSKSLDKANNMVMAMEERQKASSSAMTMGVTTTTATTGKTLSAGAASSMAKDLVHTVFNNKELTDAAAKHYLKNAAHMTPDSIKGLASTMQAKTVVALTKLVESVKQGAMGEFSQLPKQLQQNTHAAAQAADKLLLQLNNAPQTRAEVNKAFESLAKGSAPTPGQAASGKPQQVEQQAGKERDMGR